jgi:hypothetical protein
MSEFLGSGNDDGVVLGRTPLKKIGFYGVSTPISRRSGAAQATSLVGTASSTAIDTATKAALIEVMETLTALGLWQGSGEEVAQEGGGGSYTAQAVHFAGDSNIVQVIEVPTITATDSGKITYCGWFKIPTTYTQTISSPPFLTGHLGDLFFNDAEFSVPFLDYGTNVDGDLSIRMNAGAPDFSAAQFFSDGAAVQDSVWTFIMVSVDATTNPATGNVIVGNTNLHNSEHDQVDAHDPYTFSLNGNRFWFPYDLPDYGNNIGFPFDCSLIQMWTGVCLTTADVANFMDGDGKPVDPAVAAAAYGEPLFKFSGDASSFAANQGSGGTAHLYSALSANNVVSSGPGPITLPGATVGMSVSKVWTTSGPTEITSEFESTISVAGQIQQTISNDYTGNVISVAIPGTLTNATTSPSD